MRDGGMVGGRERWREGGKEREVGETLRAAEKQNSRLAQFLAERRLCSFLGTNWFESEASVAETAQQIRKSGPW